MRQCPSTEYGSPDHRLQRNVRLEGKQGLEMQVRSSTAGTQQQVLLWERRKPAQELPQVLVRAGPPPPFGLPTLCRLLAPFPFSLCLPQAPQIGSPAQGKFWLLRAPRPWAAILQGSQNQEACPTHFGVICMAAFPEQGLPYSGMGDEELGGVGRQEEWGGGNFSLEKDGDLWRCWGPSTWEPTHTSTSRHPHASREHRHPGAPHGHINAALTLSAKDRPNHPTFSCLCVHPPAPHSPFCTLEALLP